MAKVIQMKAPAKKRGRKPGLASITVEASQIRALKMILEHGLDSPALTQEERAVMYPLLMRQVHMAIAKHMDFSAPVLQEIEETQAKEPEE